MKKEEIMKEHLFNVLILRELTKTNAEFSFYQEYLDLNISPLDTTKNKSEHEKAIKILKKLILQKIGQLEYFNGI